MTSGALVPQDLWEDQESPLRSVDILSQIAHTLELLGYSKTVAALVKEAGKQDVVVDTAAWTRAIDEKTGVPLLDLYKVWLKKTKTLPTLPAPKDDSDSESEDSSDSDSDSDESMADMVEGGALVDVEAESTSDDSSDEESSASSSSEEEEEKEVAAPAAANKRKRVVTPPSSSSDDSSSADSSADEAPTTKKVKTTKAASVSSSSASDSSSDSSSASSSSSSDSDSSADSSSSDSESDSSSDDSSSSSESDAPAPPKKAKKEKKAKVEEEVPEVATVTVVEVKPKKEKKEKKDKKEKKEAPSTEAPSSTSSATLEAESASEAPENVQESSIHPSRLAQVPVVDLPAATRKQIANEGKAAVIPFSRIPVDQKVDPKFASNAYVSYDYADRAHRDLVVTKGKGFTKEKNKKKRGKSNYEKGCDLRLFNARNASVLRTAFPDVAVPEGCMWRAIYPNIPVVRPEVVKPRETKAAKVLRLKAVKAKAKSKMLKSQALKKKQHSRIPVPPKPLNNEADLNEHGFKDPLFDFCGGAGFNIF